mmetsp:Transcript_6968/g.21211  ORF Transcript_6968/g.21211 Transcript_6968/m.21211 type:complete len:370 (+) Transcript_6968:1408-2517(+)
MEKHGSCVLQRIYHEDDVVPSVPPSQIGYKHYGNPVMVTEAGQIAKGNSVSEVGKLQASQSTSTAGSHRCTNYLAAVFSEWLECRKRFKAGKLSTSYFLSQCRMAVEVKDNIDPASLSWPDAEVFITVENSEKKPHTFRLVGSLTKATSVHCFHDTVRGDLILVDLKYMGDTHLVARLEVTDFEEHEHSLTLLPVSEESASLFEKATLVFSNTFHDPLELSTQASFTAMHRNNVNKAAVTGALSRQATITIVSASNLKAADRRGTSDPYVSAKFAEQRFRTPVIPRTLSPTFKFCFELPKVSVGEKLRLKVWDHDPGPMRNDFLGLCFVRFESPLNDFERDYQLRADRTKPNVKGITGSVRVRVHFHDA